MSTNEPERTPGEAWDEEGGAPESQDRNEFAQRLLADDPDGPQPEDDEDDDSERFDAG